MSALTKQVDGDHYKKYTLQPIEFFMRTQINTGLSYAIKYLTRVGVEKDSNGIGLQKALHCLEIYSEFVLKNWKDINPKYLNPSYVEEFTSQFKEINISSYIEELLRLESLAGSMYWDETLMKYLPNKDEFRDHVEHCSSLLLNELEFLNIKGIVK